MIEVIDLESQSWILFRNAETLLLDVNCSHSAFGYSFLMELNGEEVDDYERRGREALNELADRIQYSAPMVRGSRSPYTGRALSREWGEATSKALADWKASRK